MDEHKKPPPEDEQDDVEAHGLKETVAAAAAVGAIAVPGASAYIPTVGLDGTSGKLAPASVESTSVKKKTAKKTSSAKASAGKTSPQKPVLQPEPTGSDEHAAAAAGKTSAKKPPLMPEG